MSEKRFIACDKWTDSEGNIFKFVVIDTKKLGDKQFILRCNHWSQAQDTCNRLNDILDELREENEQLKKKCDALQKKTEMDKNDFFISEAKRMTLLAFIKDKALQKEYFEWERRIYDE